LNIASTWVLAASQVPRATLLFSSSMVNDSFVSVSRCSNAYTTDAMAFGAPAPPVPIKHKIIKNHCIASDTGVLWSIKRSISISYLKKNETVERCVLDFRVDLQLVFQSRLGGFQVQVLRLATPKHWQLQLNCSNCLTTLPLNCSIAQFLPLRKNTNAWIVQGQNVIDSWVWFALSIQFWSRAHPQTTGVTRYSQHLQRFRVCLCNGSTSHLCPIFALPHLLQPLQYGRRNCGDIVWPSRTLLT
jgi:hypothetical protein